MFIWMHVAFEFMVQGLVVPWVLWVCGRCLLFISGIGVCGPCGLPVFVIVGLGFIDWFEVLGFVVLVRRYLYCLPKVLVLETVGLFCVVKV